MLTKREIDGLRYDTHGPAAQVLWDGTLPGFGLRVFASGAKSFILDYRAPDGRKRRVTLGRYGALTPAQAREKAQRLSAAVLDGADPVAERTAARGAVTVKEFAEEYIRRHSKPHKRTWKEDRQRLDRAILPALGARKLVSICRADVAALHSEIGQRAPIESNRTVSLLSSMRSRAIEWGHLPDDTLAWKVKPYREQSRDRWVRPDELPALLAAIEAEPSAYVRAALLLALLTGMRRGELLALRWQDVDLDRQEIRLPHTKAGRTHVVPLSSEAVNVLRSLTRQLGNPYVVCSDVLPGTRLFDLKRPGERVRARVWLTLHSDDAARLRRVAAAVVAAAPKHAARGPEAVEARLFALANAAAQAAGETLRLHDIRRTTGSMLALSGASLPLIGKVLNHSNASTTQIYARLTEDAPRAALEIVAAAVRKASMPAGGAR
jgi:integrase